MAPLNIAALERHLTEEEGRRQFPYTDTLGNVTIGVGHNLTGKGLPGQIIDALLAYDIAEVQTSLDQRLPWWRDLDEVRAVAIADLCFNIGITGLLTFTDTLALMNSGDWPRVADHLRASLWYREVGPIRGEKIVRAFETGAYQ